MELRDKSPFFLCLALENSFLCYKRWKIHMEKEFGGSYQCRILELGWNHSGPPSATFPSFHDCSLGYFQVFPMPKPFLVQQEEPKPGIETEVTNFREKPAPKFCKSSGSAGIPQDSCGWREISQGAKEKLPMDAPRWKMQKFGRVSNLKIKF